MFGTCMAMLVIGAVGTRVGCVVLLFLVAVRIRKGWLLARSLSECGIELGWREASVYTMGWMKIDAGDLEYSLFSSVR